MPALSATRNFGYLDERCVLAVDRELASHPDFGDADRTRRRVLARYEFAVDVLAQRLPGVAAARPVLLPGRSGAGSAAALRDPIVRMALEAALWRLERDELAAPDELEDVIALACPASVADAAAGGGPLPTEAEQETGRWRAGPGRQIWLLDLPERPGPLQHRLRQAMTEQFLVHNGVHGRLLPAGTRTVELVDRAGDLLAAILPGIAGVLEHVTVLGLMRASGADGRHLSAAGGDLVPGIIVVDPAELEDPWVAASTLLHEALHLRLFDVSRTFSLVAQPTATARIPWRRASWDIRRLLFAFHVYVHLMLFQAASSVFGPGLAARFGQLAADPGVSRGIDGAYDNAVARARYLGEQLSGPLAPRLTPDGQRLVRWLVEAVAPLTDGPLVSRPVDTTAPTTGQRAAVGPHSRISGLQTRALPELGCLYVFNPADRRLHCLNLNAWVVFELCDGRADLESAYRDLVASKLTPTQAAQHLRLALTRLREKGLIHRDP